jgi:hypothetical protein
MMTLEPVLTPHGLLTLRKTAQAPALEPDQGLQLEKAFLRGSGHGLLWLGADEVATVLPPVLSYWRELGMRYMTALCALPSVGDGRTKPPVPIPADGELDTMAAAVPPMTGAEYLTTSVLANLWRGMDAAFDAELVQAKLSVQEFLKSRHPAWNLVGRVHFNLAEHRKDEEAPFAFLATYTTRLSAEAKAQHLPLGKALQEYSGARNRQRLLSLLMPVQRAAESCPWLKTMVSAGDIFHPLRWSPQQALQFLQPSKNEHLLYISIGYGGASVSQSPLMSRLLFILACGNLRSWLLANGYRVVAHPSSSPASQFQSAVGG